MHELIHQMDQGVEENGLTWRLAHREFHASVASGAGSTVRELTVSLAERSEPYYRLYGSNHSSAHADHREILAAIERRDSDLAQARHARHVSRTALTVLANMGPQYDPRAIRASLRAFQVPERAAA